MDNEQYSTMDYAKLFLLMVIPVYGLFFTMLLAFSKDINGELKSLARGAFIARIVFLIVIGSILAVFFIAVFPMITNWINNIDLYRFFS